MVNNINEKEVREMFNISEESYYSLNNVYRDILIDKYIKFCDASVIVQYFLLFVN